MLDKKINSASLEIQVIVECSSCNGEGIIIRQPGPLAFNVSVSSKCSDKGDEYELDNVQKIINQLPTEIPGFTDRVQHLQCTCCRGEGKIKKHITLSELKQLLRE